MVDSGDRVTLITLWAQSALEHHSNKACIAFLCFTTSSVCTYLDTPFCCRLRGANGYGVTALSILEGRTSTLWSFIVVHLRYY